MVIYRWHRWHRGLVGIRNAEQVVAASTGFPLGVGEGFSVDRVLLIIQQCLVYRPAGGWTRRSL